MPFAPKTKRIGGKVYKHERTTHYKIDAEKIAKKLRQRLGYSARITKEPDGWGVWYHSRFW